MIKPSGRCTKTLSVPCRDIRDICQGLRVDTRALATIAQELLREISGGLKRPCKRQMHGSQSSRRTPPMVVHFCTSRLLRSDPDSNLTPTLGMLGPEPWRPPGHQALAGQDLKQLNISKGASRKRGVRGDSGQATGKAYLLYATAATPTTLSFATWIILTSLLKRRQHYKEPT